MDNPLDELARMIADLEDVDVHALRFIPEGANEPAPPVPLIVEISEQDIEDADKMWDKLMPEWAGFYDVQVTRRKYAE